MPETTIVSFLPTLLKILAPIGTTIIKGAGDKWDKYTGSLDEYLQKTVARHKYFSSVVFSNEGKFLEDYYLPLTLSRRSRNLIIKHLLPMFGESASIKIDGYPSELFSAFNRILVVDTAGMGKSTLFKYLFLKTVESKESIPIFVELRRLSVDLSLEDLVLQDLGSDEKQNKPFFKKCLENGAFTFYFDGFDEVSDDIKKAVSRDIVKLMEQGKNCKFLISSREEPSLTSLSQFQQFYIRPLESEEAYALIRRLISQQEVSRSLVEKIKDSPNELTEFLRNPLLVSLLVKSFLHSPVLPVHLSEFYRQVFDALYQTHDAKKELGGFARQKKSGLNLDRFHKCLRALGMITYKLGKLEYSRDEIIKEIELAKEMTSDDSFVASDFLDDLLRAVPLFVLEGLRIRWAHRSLQEYFAASYICADAKERQKPILMSIFESKTSLHNANLLRLCADMDGKTFQESVIKALLSDVAGFADEAYRPVDFPLISEKKLNCRRAVSFDSNYILYKVPTADRGNETVHISINKIERLMKTQVDSFIPLDRNLFPCEDDEPDPHFYCVRTEKKWGYVPFFILVENFRAGLWKNVPNELDERKLVGIKTGRLYEINHLPDNPLNTPSNFSVITDFLRSTNHLVDLELCKQFLSDIQKNIKKSDAIKISF